MKKGIVLLALIGGMALLGGCASKMDVAVYHAPEAKEGQPETSDAEDEAAQSEGAPVQEPVATNEAMGAGDGAQAPTPEPGQAQTPEVILETAVEAAPEIEETTVVEPMPEESADIQTDAPLGIPALSDWEKIYDTAEVENPMGDGVTFAVTWGRIDGADGYEAEVTSQSETGKEPFVKTVDVTEPTFSESFSHIYMYMKIKARAYKETESGREYGDWSLEKEMTYSPS